MKLTTATDALEVTGTMLPRGCARTSPPVDPVALLKREHKGIRDQLGMIEAVIGLRRERTRAAGSRTRSEADEADLDTLRELFRFFTGPVGVHFAREKVLIAALNRTLARGREERKQLEKILLEHRALKADAAGILKQLSRKIASGATGDAIDRSGIRSFSQHYRGLISCEERILYVLAELRLSAEEKQRVSSRMLQV